MESSQLESDTDMSIQINNLVLPIVHPFVKAIDSYMIRVQS